MCAKLIDLDSIIPLKFDSNIVLGMGMQSESPNVFEPGFDITIIESLLEDDYPEDFKELSLLKKIRLRVFGKVFVEEYKAEEWNKSLPIYAFKCPIHGVQMSYPSGWKRVLKCPDCFR
jgi:hypothetical protein